MKKDDWCKVAFCVGYVVANCVALPVGSKLVGVPPEGFAWYTWGGLTTVASGLASICCCHDFYDISSWSKTIGIAIGSILMSIATALVFSEATDLFRQSNSIEQADLRKAALSGTALNHALGACVVFALKAIHDCRFQRAATAEERDHFAGHGNL